MSNGSLSAKDWEFIQKSYGYGASSQRKKEQDEISETERYTLRTPVPEEQGFFDDVVDSVQMGAWQGASDLARGLGAIFDSDWLNQAADVAAKYAEENKETMSTKMREALEQNAFDDWDVENGKGRGIANIYWWAGNFGALIGQNLDIVVPTKIATSGVKMAGKAAGKFFTKETAEQVSKAAIKEAEKRGAPNHLLRTIGLTAAQSAMAAGSRANQVRDEIDELGDEKLAQLEGFRQTYWDLKNSEEGQNLDHNTLFDEAKERFKFNAGRDAALDLGAIATDVSVNAISGLGGGVWGAKFPPFGNTQSISKGIAKGVGIEAGTEALQGAVEQRAINETAQQFYDPTRDINQDVSRNAIDGAILGGAFGGAMGGIEARSHRNTMNREKKRLLEAVSTGDERVDEQIRAQVEAYNRMANELEELISPERLRALNQAGRYEVAKAKAKEAAEAQATTETANIPYHQRNLAELQAEFIQHGLGENDFNDFIEANLQQATTDLQQLQTNPFKMGADFQKGLAEKQAYNAKLADAQARVNFFTQAKNVPKFGTEPQTFSFDTLTSDIPNFDIDPVRSGGGFGFPNFSPDTANADIQTQSEPQVDLDGFKFSRSAMKSVEANIARGREAMTKAILDKSSVHRAMYRNDLDGWIDFEWGDVGKMLPNGKTKGAMGLSHIIDKRMAVDGMSEQEVTRFLVDDITETIAKGTIERENVFEKTRTVQISYNGNEVRITKKQGNNGWVVTGFKQYQPMNQSRGATTSDLRNVDPIRSRIELGAVGTENLPSFANDVKFSRSAPQETQSFYETEQRLGGKEAYEQAVKEGKTELDYRQWVQVRTPEFKAWFGDWENDPQNASKVINPKTGEPLVVYHGTNAEFNTFDKSKQRNDRNQYGEGFYFTGKKETADLFGSNTKDVFLRTRYTHMDRILAKRKGENIDHMPVDYMRPDDSRDIWVVRNPNQIKSATDNTGEFDVNNDDIRFSKALQKPERLEKLRQSQPIEITGTEIKPSDDIREYKRNALEYGKSLRGSYVNKDTGKAIELGAGGVKEILQHDYKDIEHLQSIAAIPKIIENAIYIDTLPNEDVKNPHINAYEYYVAGLKIDGVDYTVKAAVGISPYGDRYYDHKLTKIEKGKLLEARHSDNKSGVPQQQIALGGINDKRLLQILQQENQTFDFTHEKSQIATAVGKGLSKHFDLAHSSELGINDPTIEAAYNTKTGKIVIIADNIRANSVLSREERLKWVAWHELAHRGLQVRFGGAFRDLMQTADRNSTVNALATALQKDRSELKDNRILAVEEAIAELHAAYTTGKMEELKSRYGLEIPLGKEKSLKAWFKMTAERIREVMAKLFGLETANRFSHDDLLNLLKDIQQSAGGDVNGVESDVRHSFAGENAKTANHSLLAQAKSAVANGANPEDVRKQTGWFQGVDGKWRFEIDDNVGSLILSDRAVLHAEDTGENTYTGSLEEVWHNPEIFEAYPELKNYRVSLIPLEQNIAGYIEPNQKEIVINATINDVEMEKTFIHELQHVIQNIEGFGQGGNTHPDFIKNVLSQIQRGKGDNISFGEKLKWRARNLFESKEKLEKAQKLAKAHENSSAMDIYQALAGEVEARNTENRLWLTKEQRLAYSPFDTQDIASDRQIVRYGDSVSYSLNEDPNSSFANAIPKRTAMSFDEARSIVSELLGEPLVNKETGMVATVSKRSLEKLLSGKAAHKSSNLKDHLTAVANIDQLFENAILGWTEQHKNADPNISGVHKLFAPLNIDGQVKLAKLTVKEMAFNQGNRMYSVETIEVENENGILGNLEARADVNQPTSPQNADVQSLIQRIQKFNSGDQRYRFSRSQSNVERLRGLNQPTKLDNMKDVAKAMANRPLSEWKSLMVEYGKKANTKIFDALAPIKYAEDKAGISDHSQSAYTAARLAAGSASIAEASMLYGLPEYREGIIQRKNGTTEKDALFGILQALGNDANDFLAWVAGNRADKLMQEGRENHFSQAEIDELKALNRGREQRFEQARQKLMAWNQSLLDLAEHSGLINQEDRAKWEDKDFYIPFYREDDDGDAIAPYRNKGLSGQNAGIKRLKGSDKAINDLLENVITNATKLIDASVKNAAMTKAVTNLADTGVISLIENPTYADWKKLGSNKHGADKDGGVAMVRIEGKEQMVRINDAMLFNAITSIDQQPLDYPFRKLFAGPKRVLTSTVTSMPNFIVRNFLRDMAQAWVVDRNNGFKLGMDSIKGLKDAYKRSGSSIDLMFAGASFGAGYVNGGNPEQAATQIRRYLRKQGKSAAEIDGFMDGVIFSKDQLMDLYGKYKHLSHAAENANRIAVYDRAIASGKSKAQAALESKDLMDFSMHGSAKALRVLGDVLPFFNARLQGMSQLGRAFKDNPRELAKRGAMIALASVALVAMNQGEEWYEEQSDEIKDNFWLANIGGQIIKIPKPFELGVVFGTVPERLFRTMSGADDTGRFKDRLLSAISNTLSLNPIPQAVKPIFEVYNNYDSFRGREIETLSDRRLLKEARFDDRTSLFSRGIAGATSVFGLSPKQTDHLIHGYFGTLGMYVLGMSDVAIRQAGGYGELPAKNWSEYPVLDAVFGGDVMVPRKYTRYMNDYYHFLNQVSEISATVNSYKADGRKAEAKLLLAENQRLLAYKPVLSQTQKELKAIKAKMDAIQNNGNLSAAEKRQRLDRLRENKNAIVRMVVERMEKEDF